MKNKFFLILIFFFLPLSNFVKAEVKIAFIDMEQVINTSNVGLKLIKKIELMDVKFKEKFSSNERSPKAIPLFQIKYKFRYSVRYISTFPSISANLRT